MKREKGFGNGEKGAMLGFSRETGGGGGEKFYKEVAQNLWRKASPKICRVG